MDLILLTSYFYDIRGMYRNHISCKAILQLTEGIPSGFKGPDRLQPRSVGRPFASGEGRSRIASGPGDDDDEDVEKMGGSRTKESKGAVALFSRGGRVGPWNFDLDKVLYVLMHRVGVI